MTSCTSAACAAAQAHADRIVKLRKIPIDVFASVSDLQAFKDGNEQAVAKAKEKMTKTKMALVLRYSPLHLGTLTAALLWAMLWWR